MTNAGESPADSPAFCIGVVVLDFIFVLQSYLKVNIDDGLCVSLGRHQR
jgi:hypothetical protein